MAENSKIQWCDHTFNPWRGCTKVAAGCQNCYADRQSKRNPGVLGTWGPSGTRVVASDAAWKQPVKWDKSVETTAGVWPDHRLKVFCASLCDVFEDWTQEMRDSKGKILHRCCAGQSGCNRAAHMMTMDDARSRLFGLIDATPNLDWLLLTKRPENIRKMWCSHVNTDGKPPSQLHRANVWLGCSVSTQQDADRNIPLLLKCRNLSPVLFLSIEPLIEQVDMAPFLYEPCRHCIDYPLDPETNLVECRPCDSTGIGDEPREGLWVIVGGESGPNTRPCNIEWVRTIVTQCRHAGTPCFVKQLGSQPIEPDDSGFVRHMMLTDKKGGDPDEWPEDLRVRKFPLHEPGA